MKPDFAKDMREFVDEWFKGESRTFGTDFSDSAEGVCTELESRLGIETPEQRRIVGGALSFAYGSMRSVGVALPFCAPLGALAARLWTRATAQEAAKGLEETR